MSAKNQKLQHNTNKKKKQLVRKVKVAQNAQVKKEKDLSFKHKHPKVSPAKKGKNDDYATNVQRSLSIPVVYDTSSVTSMWLSLISVLLSKGWNSETVLVGGATPAYLWNAYVTLQSVTFQAMAGTTLEASTYPKYIMTILNMLKPKNPYFANALLSYNWNNPQPAIQTQSLFDVNVAGRSFKWVFGDPDPSAYQQYDQPIIPYEGSPLLSSTDLQRMFSVIESVNKETKLVDTSYAVGLKDASAFGRFYSYYGGGNSISSAWSGNAEMETYIKSPWYCKYATYDDAQLRNSTSYRVMAGDSTILGALPFMSQGGGLLYKNQLPPILKPIDFNEIYDFVVEWATQAWSTARSIGTESTELLFGLNFTSQDFRIVLRQALLSIFQDQFAVQFMSPRKSSGNPTDNTFAPFILHAGTSYDPAFGSIKLPTFLVENLKALKTTCMTLAHNHHVVHMPILGLYVTDTYSKNLQIGSPSENSIFLFADDSSQISINLIDGNAGQTMINLNSAFYKVVLEKWNTVVSAFATAGGPTSSLAGDAGPGFNLLIYTRYVIPIPEDAVPFKILDEAIEKRKKMKDLKSDQARKSASLAQIQVVKKRLDNLRMGDSQSTASIGTNYITSCGSLNSLFQSMESRLILPQMRSAENETVDPWSINMSQVATREPLSIKMNGGNLGREEITVGSRHLQIMNSARACCTGIFNDQNNDQAIEYLKNLGNHNKGLNIGSLFAGIADAIIPGAGTIVNSILG